MLLKASLIHPSFMVGLPLLAASLQPGRLRCLPPSFGIIHAYAGQLRCLKCGDAAVITRVSTFRGHSTNTPSLNSIEDLASAIPQKNPASQQGNYHQIAPNNENIYEDAMYEFFVKRADGQEQYQCIFLDCSHAPFPRFDNARAHVRSCHFQHNGYTRTCGKAYKNVAEARRHAKRENNGPSFKCRYCPLMLTRRTGKVAHETICKERPTGTFPQLPPST
ncbi:hypothetical protein JB92DRAFT_3060649 [Gautieria morchelliformis]|nr:hypothetical protein JB92DRAFT_3060649 [Gautieria morchelliformis]